MSSKLLIDQRFSGFFWTQFFGALNDNVFKNSLVILITFRSFSFFGVSSEQMVALCGAIFILPFFLFSSLAGQLADKYSKSQMTVWIKYWEALVMIVGAIGLYTNDIMTMFIALFLMGTQSSFFGPVKYSIMPDVLRSDELIAGNAYVEMGTFVAILLGTILGGVLIAHANSYVAVTVLLLAVIGIFSARKIPQLKAGNMKAKISLNLVTSTYRCIKYVKINKHVFWSIFGISWFWFFGAVLLSMFPTYVKNEINGDESLITLFLAIFSVGVAVGSLLSEYVVPRLGKVLVVSCGLFGMGVSSISLYCIRFDKLGLISIREFFNANGSLLTFMAMLMISISSGFFIVPLYALMQKASPVEIRSQVIGANNIINALFMVISSLLLAFCYSLGLSTLDIFLYLGCICLIITLLWRMRLFSLSFKR